MSEVIIPLVAATGVAAVVTYYFLRKMAMATKEYNEASGVVKNIVLTFNRRQEEQDRRIEETAYKTESAESRSERLSEQVNTQAGRINYLTSNVKDVWSYLKQVAGHVATTSERVNAVEKNQKEMQHQISDLQLKYVGMLPEKEAQQPPVIKGEHTLDSLTETEKEVLQTLASQGSKSATELSRITKKTREHTARTMKKLFQLGYVNRETHKLPYRYMLNDKVQKAIQEAKKQESQTTATA